MNNQRSQQHFLSIGLIVISLAGIIIAQTFTYSHGWTNGKKRSSIIPFVFQDSSEGQEILGICQMQRLREILQGRHRDQVDIYLPPPPKKKKTFKKLLNRIFLFRLIYRAKSLENLRTTFWMGCKGKDSTKRIPF